MATNAEPEFAPRFPLITAIAVFTAAALALLYPMLSGHFLAGSDQVSAGYAFREFAATSMHQTGHLPQWNPFIFGGMPLWAVPGHFDVFYPTAWLRWFMSGGTVLNLSFFIHLVVAGTGMYTLLRALRLGWTAALVGGIGYELTGIVASQVAPGHDGKLYAASLAPFAFAALVRAIRDGRIGAYGWFALVVGLVMLTPHYLAAYYLLVACGLWALWLTLLDPERPVGRSPAVPLGLAALAVALGVGLAMVELLPSLHMVPFTPRAVGGDSGGWTYATSYSMPVEELMSAILPQFNGMHPDHYWGQNPFKDHTEYLGAMIAMLAVFGTIAARRTRLLLPVAGIGGLFLLVAFGNHTPFYSLWYHLPRMSQFRAPGFAFFMVALMTCVLAGFGVQDLLAGRVSFRMVAVSAGVLAIVALAGSAGALQSIAEGLAVPQRADRVVANAPFLQEGSIRLLIAVIASGVVLMLVQRRTLQGMLAAGMLAVVAFGDNWSILRTFPEWLPPASVTFGDDVVTAAMKKTPMPFRVYDPSVPEPVDQASAQLGAAGVYSGSSLMARGIPTLFGYHGMESRFFDALLGGKNFWAQQTNPTLWNLYAIRFITLTAEPQAVPGFHKLMGPVALDDIVNVPRPNAVVFERDSAPQWVRVIPAATKVPDDQIVPTVTNPQFRPASFVVLPDTVATKQVVAMDSLAPAAAAAKASLAAWQPGAMTVKLDGSDTRTTYLMVSENWYPDWHATVDGAAATPLRGDGALLTIELPPGARQVQLWFDVASYHRGAWLSLLALVLVGGWIATGVWQTRTRTVNA